MENTEVDMKGKTVYELGYLVLPSIPEEKLPEIAASLKKVIVKEGGVELDGEAPFKQSLAYSMSKTVGASRYVVSDAYLGWMKFEVESAKVAGVKDGVEKIEEILRFLIVKAPRETTFTLAKARAVVEEVEEEPASVEDSGVAKEVVVE